MAPRPLSPLRLPPSLAALVALTLGAGPLAAQLPPLTVPKRHVRVDLGGSFAAWDQRFLAGKLQPAAQDFMREQVGSDFFPALAPAESILARVTGLAGSRFDLGKTTATHFVTRGTTAFGLAYGLTSKLTLFGVVPIVWVDVRSTFGQEPGTANSGFNPASPVFGDAPGQVQSAQFFNQFDTALSTLAKQISEGAYDGDAATKQLAEETLATGTALQVDLFALIAGPGASPFLPTQSSATGTALVGTVTALQATLSGSLGVTGFEQTPALPSQPLGNADFSNFVSNADGPVAGSLAVPPTLTALGDIELGAAYAIIDQLGRPGVRSGFRLAAQGLMRLRTSTRPRPGLFFDVGTGDRQPDLEFGMAADGLYHRFGARLSAGYNLQLTGKAKQRISAPWQPIAYANTLAALQDNLGDEIRVGLMPFFRLAPTFGLVAGLTYTRKGADSWSLLAGQDSIPAAPPTLVGLDSEASWTTAMAGVSFSSPLDVTKGKPKLPLDAGFIWEGVIAGSGGRTPKSSTVRFFIRLYRRFP